MASLALSNRQSGAPQEYVTKPRPFDRTIRSFGEFFNGKISSLLAVPGSIFSDTWSLDGGSDLRRDPASHETAFGQYVHNVKNAPTVLEGVNEGVNNLAETVYKSLGGLFGRRK